MQDQHEGQEATGLEIAIVGMAARVPGAPDIDTFWNNIRDGVESVVHYTDAELRERGVAQALIDDPHYVKAGVPFEGADLFDAGMFGYTPRDAELLDPQHRIFLECAFEALEHAGYAGPRGGASVGVYAGSGASVYLMRQLLPHYDLEQGGIADLLGLMGGNLPDSLCTSVAYKLDLRGPAVTVQTACSTSLMAVHAACQALLNHECDLALAGGVSLNLLQNGGYRHQAGAILSPDGHCRAFDASAAGTVQGSGAGIVVLKRLDQALRDGDTIHAIIKGSAANNDGADKVGFSAPSIGGQAAVIRAAQLMAGVGPESIGYVEAHGTGTTLGDPIEIAALTQAYQAGAGGKGYCAIGSVKTNVGHLDAAAGVTGLIKTVLALKHRTLPPSLNFERPNPQIDFANSPFYVNTVAKPWDDGAAPRRAGVSSFGIGGTNVHVVLEEAVQHGAAGGTAGLHALLLSARSAPALQTMAARLAGHLEGRPELNVGDVAYTLRAGRKRFAHRAVALVRDGAEAIHALRRQEAHVLYRGVVLSERPTVAFLFPGQGAQHVDMGRALYESESEFRATVDRCCALLQPHLGLDLRTLLYPVSAPADSAAAERVARTAITQPALFVIEYAMAQWWMQQGIEPDALLGHSIGEYVAACLAGVFTLDDALAVVAARGRLLQAMAPGAMLAVGLSEQALRARADAGCDLAAVNGAELCVLAGPPAAIEHAERDLAQRGVVVRRLHVSHAFHSAAVEPMLDEFAALLSRTSLSAPRMAFVSNLSGNWITAQEACDPGYWVRHVRGTVRFADGLDALFAKTDRVLLEVGPGNALSTLARRHPQGATRPVLATQCHPDRAIDNAVQPQRCLAQLWVAGIEAEATVRPEEAGRRVPLPTYPFERRSYWIERPAAGLAPSPPAKARGDLSGWCYVPAWQRSPGPARAAASNQAARGVVLVMGDAGTLDDRLLTQLYAQERRVVQVERGAAFVRRGAHHYVARPAERDDMEQLLRSVETELGPVSDICHAWSIGADALEAGFYSLLALVQALEVTTSQTKLVITVVASGLQDVTGTEPLCAEKATLLGLCQVIPQEYPQLACRLVDVQAVAGDEHRLARQILAEIDSPGGEALVAYRGPHRWIRSFIPAPDGEAGPARLRREGVYLITGGLGGIGLALARYLARQWQARLVLLGRRTTPEQLQSVADLQALGVEVLVLQADVADVQQMRDAVAAARKRFGALHGIVHAAGVTGGGMIAAHSRATVEPVFAAKVYGTQALLAATAGVPLDFVAFCSSLSSLAGGLGKGAYAAANAYLDAAAAAANRATDTLVVSIGWDGWREVGMAAGMRMPDDVGVATEQGAQLFERIVQGPAQAHVVVSSIDLEARLRGTGGDLLALMEAPAAGERRTEARPPLQTPFVAPSGDIEESLAQLWSAFLGIAPVGCQDNLFELGADSLLAIQLLAKVRQVYGVGIHPAAFFKAPTVAALALLVEDRLIEQIELSGADSHSTATP